MEIVIHYCKRGKWASIKARKNGKLNKQFSAEDAVAEAEKLMQQGASYVELVQLNPRCIYKQFGTIPLDK